MAQELVVGDEVIISDTALTPEDRHGTIVAFNGTSYGVDIGREYRGHTHALDGSLQTPTGRWYSPTLLKRMEKVAPEGADELAEAIKNVPMLMVIGNDTFSMSRLRLDAPSAILAEKEKVLTNAYTTLKKTLEAKVKKAERDLATTIALPAISVFDLASYNITMGNDDGRLTFILPIVYKPQFMIRKGEGNTLIRKELSKKHQDILRKDCLLQITFDAVNIAKVMLRRKEDLGRLTHYHSLGDSQDCTGSVDLVHTKKTVKDVLAFRDHYQATLETINRDSLGSRQGEGQPHIDTIEKEAIEIAGEDSWSVERKAGRFLLGQLVQVISVRDSFPPEYVGAIGKVVSVGLAGSDAWIGVEFGFLGDYFHNADGNGRSGYCYNFFSSDIVLAPEGRRRNRVPPSEESEEEDD